MRRLLALLLALPACALAAPEDDFAHDVAEAINRVCQAGGSRSVLVKAFDSVRLNGNGGVDEAENAVLIRAGSPVQITFDPAEARSLSAIKCDLKVRPVTVKRGERLVVQRISGAPDPFLTAVLAGDVERVRNLIDAGQEINLRSPMPPLMAAAGRGHLEMTRLLLERGAKVNARGQNAMTALHAAAGRGATEVAALLIERGARVDAVDVNGHTPLWAAAYNDQPAMIELLLKRGAKLQRRDKFGNTALSLAAANGADAAIARLVELGLKPDSANNFGRTPLFDAIDGNRESTVALLVGYKVDVNAKTRSGQTPLALAKTKGYSNIIEALEKAGAR